MAHTNTTRSISSFLGRICSGSRKAVEYLLIGLLVAAICVWEILQLTVVAIVGLVVFLFYMIRQPVVFAALILVAGLVLFGGLANAQELTHRDRMESLKTAFFVLDRLPSNHYATWFNMDSGNRGKTEILGEAQKGSGYCRKFRVTTETSSGGFSEIFEGCFRADTNTWYISNDPRVDYKWTVTAIRLNHSNPSCFRYRFDARLDRTREQIPAVGCRVGQQEWAIQ